MFRTHRLLGILPLAFLVTACSEDAPADVADLDAGTLRGADAGATAVAPTAIEGLGGSARECTARSNVAVDPSAGNRACATCLLAQCKAPVQTAYGNDMNFFSGTCGTYSQCFCYCRGPSDTKCIDECASKIDEVCRADLSTVNSCRTSKCASQCSSVKPSPSGGSSGPSGTPGSGATAPECVALMKCCNTLTNTTLIPTCKAVANAGEPTACTASLTTRQAAGLCPR